MKKKSYETTLQRWVLVNHTYGPSDGPSYNCVPEINDVPSVLDFNFTSFVRVDDGTSQIRKILLNIIIVFESVKVDSKSRSLFESKSRQDLEYFFECVNF